MSMEEKKDNLVSEEETEVSEESLNELRKIRRDKLKALQDAGRNPFLVEKWDVTAHSMDIKENFDAMEDQEVSCAGRIMAFRNMGKASFIDIQDKQGRIQCYVRKDVIGDEEYQWFKGYDIGDIVGVEGTVFKTKHGEVSIKAAKVVLLTKSLQILPDKCRLNRQSGGQRRFYQEGRNNQRSETRAGRRLWLLGSGYAYTDCNRRRSQRQTVQYSPQYLGFGYEAENIQRALS